jgi:hypothetical protein
MIGKIELNKKTEILLITLAVALVTVMVILYIIRMGGVKVSSLRKEIDIENHKIVLRKDIAKIENINNQYLKYLHSREDAAVLRDSVSNLVRAVGADILSIRPMGETRYGDYVKVSYELVVRCTYNQLGELLEKIEDQTALTKIDDLKLATAEGETFELEKFSPDTKTRAEATLFISAYYQAK